PAREVPEAADDQPAVDPAPAALWIRDPRGDQGIRVLAPYLFLGALVVEREHPVVDAEVRDVPARRGAAARDLGRHVEEGHEVELHAAPAPGLVEAKEPRAVQVLDRLRRHLAPRFRAERALTQGGHQRARPAHRLVVTDVGEARGRAPGSGHARMLAT